MKALVRGFARNTEGPEPLRLVFEKEIDTDSADLESLGEEHVLALALGKLQMIEFEFLDEPEDRRFFRIGTGPEGMVQPVGIRLNKLE